MTGRLFTFLGWLLLVSACQTPAYVEPRDGPPTGAHGDLSRLPDPVPRQETKSRYGNPAAYSVNGKTYYVRESATGYQATGLASWYGKKFHGRRTSSGEPFDMFKLTAAHKSLPIPTYVRITNLQNGRKTVVRVNDRGPFVDDRIIDLSYAAAVKLGFADVGTARVRVEAFERQAEFYLQAGAFRRLEAADRLQRDLQRLTGESAYVIRMAEDPPYRVRLGPVVGEREAKRLQALITSANYGRPMIFRQ